MKEVVIASAVRTPFGRFGGALRDIPSQQLGALVIKEALQRINLPFEQVDEVIFGQVIGAGVGQVPARQAAILAGIPPWIPALSINKVCASGLRAVTIAYDVIKAGSGEVVVAGGMESMSQVPYLSSHRFSKPMGHGQLKDALLVDGLMCPFGDVHMGVLGEKLAKEFSITREDQDSWALTSHQRAVAAWQGGRLKDELIPVPIKDHKGKELSFAKDESPREDTSFQALSRLKPVFVKEGTITAGNAPGINDGACALILMTREKALELGITPLATIIDYSMVAQEPERIATVPALAALKLLEKTELSLSHIDLLEVNEAFAAVLLVSTKIMGWDLEKVNVNGGAIAFGHPIGVSGARILTTLCYQLKREKLNYGLATICSGTAQGDAILIRSL